MTGAPLPEGADAVVPLELTDGGVSHVRIDRAVDPGAYVRRAGEDVAAGETVLRAGSILGSAPIGLAAAVGRDPASWSARGPASSSCRPAASWSSPAARSGPGRSSTPTASR